MPKLERSTIDFIMKMKDVNYSNCEIARKLGVTEGAIRYRIKREKSGKPDGRKDKPSMLDQYLDVISRWIDSYEDKPKRPALIKLFDILSKYHDYRGSYDLLRKYVIKRFPDFYDKKSFMRIETPAGELTQVDWKEDLKVRLGSYENVVKIQALCFVLGFSRKMSVKFRLKKDLASFINAHQEAFRSFGGMTRFIRSDCLKSAVKIWKGSKSELNQSYGKYLNQLNIAAFPARPGTPTDKGKIEKRILDLFRRVDLESRVFADLNELERVVNEELEKLEEIWHSGATGLSVARSFEYERKQLLELPASFPVIPVMEKKATVRNDGTVAFCSNYYQVDAPKRAGVLCQNTGKEILIYRDGIEIERFPYLPESKGMVMLSENALKNSKVHLSDIVLRWSLTVASRQAEVYGKIIEGAA